MTVQQKPPADTGEQSMTTITQEQADAFVTALLTTGVETAAAFQKHLGITITPPEPPEAMVELAREIVAVARERGCGNSPELFALATLQHVVAEARAEQSSWTKDDPAWHAMFRLLIALRAA